MLTQASINKAYKQMRAYGEGPHRFGQEPVPPALRREGGGEGD